jgi:hypothetical protein
MLPNIKNKVVSIFNGGDRKNGEGPGNREQSCRCK